MVQHTIAIRALWQVSIVPTALSAMECVMLDLSASQISGTLICIYRPPNSNFDAFLAELESLLRGISVSDFVCVIGDMNVDTLNSW